MGIHPEVHHHECGPSEQEFTYSPEFGMNSPDNAFRLKHVCKEIAVKHNMIATFMSQPFPLPEAGIMMIINNSLSEADYLPYRRNFCADKFSRTCSERKLEIFARIYFRAPSDFEILKT